MYAPLRSLRATALAWRRVAIARYGALSVLIDAYLMPPLLGRSCPGIRGGWWTRDVAATSRLVLRVQVTEVRANPPLESGEAYQGADWDTTFASSSDV
ncbi:hypothetical protein EYR40_010577 [Pleurotus pulmonarius]|nr:hypothetical protein EYR36_010032 [Pleurotus pulmonarius]KAF4589021.1 hypothetical protein EYR40_010577 [Pleurotus pulmonarius]